MELADSDIMMVMQLPLNSTHMCILCGLYFRLHGFLCAAGASLKFTVLNPKGRVWLMVAGGGASVIYAGRCGWGYSMGGHVGNGAPASFTQELGKIDHVCIHLVLTHTVAVLCCVLCHALQTLLATWASLRS